MYHPTRPQLYEYNSSQQVTSALCDVIVRQDDHYGYEITSETVKAKSTVRQQNKERILDDIEMLMPQLTNNMQRSVKTVQRKGCILMANCSAIEEPQIYTSQASFSGRPFSALWVDNSKVTIKMCLRILVYSRTCPLMCEGRISL